MYCQNGVWVTWKMDRYKQTEFNVIKTWKGEAERVSKLFSGNSDVFERWF